MLSLCHCCSDKAVGKVISVRVLHIILSPHHRKSFAVLLFLRPPACLSYTRGSLWISAALLWCILLVFSNVTGRGRSSVLHNGKFWDTEVLLKSGLVRRICKAIPENNANKNGRPLCFDGWKKKYLKLFLAVYLECCYSCIFLMYLLCFDPQVV